MYHLWDCWGVELTMTWKEGPRPIAQSFHAHASCRVDIGMRCCPISRSSCFACFVCKWCLMLVVVCCGVVLMLACDVAKRAVTPCRHCLDMPFAHFVCKCVLVQLVVCWDVLVWLPCDVVHRQRAVTTCVLLLVFASILLAVCWGVSLTLVSHDVRAVTSCMGWP